MMASLISAVQLRQLAPGLLPARAELLAAVLTNACEEAQIDTAIRICEFLGQTMVETGGFRSLIESTNYKDPVRLDALFKNVQGVDHAKRLIEAGPVAIGNTIYACKNGNGGVDSGDGYRYRGRGFLQVTGRANYRTIGNLVDMPLEQQPELLGEPEPAAKAACTFWKMRNINTPADAGDVSMVTYLVNGPMKLHLEERKKWVQSASAIWT